MEKLLTKMVCASFTKALASKAPTPGGGGAAALAGALSVTLCEMAGNLTSGKKTYASVEADIRKMIEQTEKLRQRFLELIYIDARAFEPLSRAYSKPKSDVDYTAVLRQCTLDACAAPLEMMRCCGEAVALVEEMLEKGSRMLVSDVGCAAALARSALEAAAMNVYVNTRIIKNDAAAMTLEREADVLLRDYVQRSQAVSDAVLQRLKEG